MADESFEPRLVGFLCRWCTYTGADLAGISRLKYPPNLTPIKVMCSGRVDPTFIVQAFAEGADGVLIGGCHPGDCHYDVGNYRTMRRFPMLLKLLEQFGIERDRVWLRWISASEGKLFADTIRDFTARIKELGPLSWPEKTRAITESVA
ncbi:MAG TPA: hydrogenase iron-sulfur subunit [Candidatus Coatesbacteria bacterium]|nr:hydrogenase iron-sulfur subunit [Candidatus Coatesbacteria bacterium]